MEPHKATRRSNINNDPEDGFMDARVGEVTDAEPDAVVPAKNSLGWAVIIPAMLWIGLGTLIAVVIIVG